MQAYCSFDNWRERFFSESFFNFISIFSNTNDLRFKDLNVLKESEGFEDPKLKI